MDLGPQGLDIASCEAEDEAEAVYAWEWVCDKCKTVNSVHDAKCYCHTDDKETEIEDDGYITVYPEVRTKVPR